MSHHLYRFAFVGGRPRLGVTYDSLWVPYMDYRILRGVYGKWGNG